MTAKTTIPTDLDFDGTDDKKLDEEIKKAGHELENRYIVRYPNLYVKTVSGNVYRLPLAVKRGYFDDLDDAMTPVDQMRAILLRENPSKGKALDGELMTSLLAMSDRWSEIVGRVQMASLGKSKPSGDK